MRTIIQSKRVMESGDHLKNGASSKSHRSRKIYQYVALAALLGVCAGCSQRIIDFTVISSKNHGLQFDLSNAKRVEGTSMQFLGFGTTIKTAMDNALESAGIGYDLLVDGVVSRESFFFVAGFKVTGTAVQSKKLKADLGEDGFLQWQKAHNVFDPTTAIVQE